MENTIKPDRKYWTAQLLILAVISGITLISAGVLHLIINYSKIQMIYLIQIILKIDFILCQIQIL